MIEGMSWWQLGAIWGVGALITGVCAVIKVGLHSAPIYWLVGVLLGPLSILVLVLDRRKKCPFCHHSVMRHAKVCSDCGHRLVYAHP
ncbi:MAG: hypothetical protein ACKVJG_23375 [Candidatus Latescibacterota bacterium]|jgi:hypothetical protein